jgi:hypothetical protein
MYTGHNTSSVQLLGNVSLVQTCWITACNASTRLGPPFFNSSAAIESAPTTLLFFRYFSAPSISSMLGKSMSTPSSLKSTGRVGWSDLEPSFKCSSKCSSASLTLTITVTPDLFLSYFPVMAYECRTTSSS